MKPTTDMTTPDSANQKISKQGNKLTRFFKGFLSNCNPATSCCSTCANAGSDSCGCASQSLRLADLKIGQTARVLGIDTCNSCQFRLVDLGLSAGVDIVVRERALFGGPMIVKAKGTVLALRPSEASCIKVVLTD